MRYYFIFLFIGFTSVAQNSYIINNEGKKTMIIDWDFYSAWQKTSLRYGNGFSENINIKKLEKLVDKKGGVYSRIKVNGEKEYHFFKPLIVTKDKKLLVAFAHTQKDGPYAYYRIVDNDNNLLSKSRVGILSTDRDGAKVFLTDFKKHFADCPKAMESIAYYESLPYDLMVKPEVEEAFAGFMFQAGTFNCE